MIKVIVLDLDDTLIDTSSLEPLRSAGRWRDIHRYFNGCAVYQGVVGLVTTARSVGIKVAIFSNAPSNYVQGLLKHFSITVDYVVAYHDVTQHKPSPEGVTRILEYFGVSADESIYLGDSNLDRDAAFNAGVEFFSVDWGSASEIDSSHKGVSNLSELIGKNSTPSSATTGRSELIQSGNKLHLGFYLDGVKQEVWSFKDNKNPSVRRWVNKTVELAPSFPVIDIVVRALGHAELRAEDGDKALDTLGKSLAVALGATYQPKILEKKHVLVKSTNCSAVQRRQQVGGAYKAEVDSIEANSNPTFLIVDDVLTSGATTDEITRCLSQAFPNSSIYIFTLVKTLYRLELSTDSIEQQHNNQLFSDLYNPIIDSLADESELSGYVRPKSSRRLVSKKFSANYARTNHNFIFHNLLNYSISSEVASGQLFGAIQVLKNILQRGKPTIASRKLRKAFGIELEQSALNTPAQALLSDKSVFWNRLIRGNKQSGSYPAKRFFDELIPKYFGKYIFVKQLMLPEVQIYDMTQVYVEQFQNQQVDFYIPQVGLIIEIDGQQHQNSQQLDEMRDLFTETQGLKTVRFTVQELASENQSFISKINSIISHIQIVDGLERDGVLTPPNGISLLNYQEAYENGVDVTDSRLRLTSALRFQILLLELLERGQIRLGELKKLFIVNRDGTVFAEAALDDLNDLLSNIFRLIGIEEKRIEVALIESDELPSERSGENIFIDFSILERYDDSFQVNKDVIYSRTDYFDFYRYFEDSDAVSIETSQLIDYDFFELSCSDPIAYKLDLSPGSEQRESLRYFLSNLFLPYLEDVDFREGQVGIIGSALSRNGTIGLLPTGSGKSICYQLSAVLQPAVSFVVCPIKSLMYDQKADLDSIGFTRSNFITSDLKAGEKAKVQRDFGRGKYFFVFISPERFQTHAFRKEMLAIGLDLSFAYAVIDEAHCLSEWGHDFRTSYLNLANTIGRFAPSAIYIGLTATASVNVLKDIQTEFDIPDDFVRTPMDFTREELSFHVIDDKGRKVDAAVELVSEMERKWNSDGEYGNKAGIIFTATVNGSKGCHSLAGRISTLLNMDVRYFSGSAPKMGVLQGEAFDRYKRQVQDDFKENKYRLLTATKAFGMGVNKGNIAYTIHFGIPGSMEALYQEAGRAGRDKKLFKEVPADCYVLLTKEPNSAILDKIWDASTNVKDLKEYVKLLSRDSDLNTNLFLMTNSLDTINDEFKLMANVYEFFKYNQEHNTVIITARQFGTEKFKLEKAIYRLSQLGIVSDWVIEDFFNGTLYVEFQCLSEEGLENKIEHTVRKYDPEFKLADVFSSDNQYYKILCDKLRKGSIDKSQFIFLVLLLWSYDHFVYNRRQSQQNVYEHCSLFAEGRMDGKEFKEKLEGYFRHDKSSQLLLYMAENSASAKLWPSVFFETDEEEGTEHLVGSEKMTILRGQISRFLESYKDNAFLNYLSGVLRLASDEFDDADGERRMASSFDRLISDNRDEALELVRKTMQLKPMFSENARSRFARLVHEKFEDLDFLEEVNEELGDPFSYHTLLAPLAIRLEKLTSLYKGINW